jgi:hypothetical protein
MDSVLRYRIAIIFPSPDLEPHPETIIILHRIWNTIPRPSDPALSKYKNFDKIEKPQ